MMPGETKKGNIFLEDINDTDTVSSTEIAM
jgi:hypothetical protein